jgi:hypothetical protein
VRAPDSNTTLIKLDPTQSPDELDKPTANDIVAPLIGTPISEQVVVDS